MRPPRAFAASVLVVVIAMQAPQLSGANVAQESWEKLSSMKKSRVQSDGTTVLASGKIGEAGEAAVTDEAKAKAQEKLVEVYAYHFKLKRKQQIKTAENLLGKESYAKQYKLVKVLLDEIFRTLRQAQTNLTDVDLAAIPALPTHNQTILDSLLSVWENTAFLGDVLLRLPDISHRMIDKHTVRKEVIFWAIQTCYGAPMYDATQQQQLDLMLQETKLAKQIDHAYENPFAEATILRKKIEMVEVRELQIAELEKLKRRKERKPTLSHTFDL